MALKKASYGNYAPTSAGMLWTPENQCTHSSCITTTLYRHTIPTIDCGFQFISDKLILESD